MAMERITLRIRLSVDPECLPLFRPGHPATTHVDCARCNTSEHSFLADRPRLLGLARPGRQGANSLTRARSQPSAVACRSLSALAAAALVEVRGLVAAAHGQPSLAGRVWCGRGRWMYFRSLSSQLRTRQLRLGPGYALVASAGREWLSGRSTFDGRARSQSASSPGGIGRAR